MAPIMVLPQHPYLDISVWLDMLDLRQYDESFSNFIDVKELMYFCEADIKKLGVRNSAHRAHMVSSLVALRDNHKRGTRTTNRTHSRKSSNSKSQRHSTGAIYDSQNREIRVNESLTAPETRHKQSNSLDYLLDMEPPANETDAGSGGSTPSTPTEESIALKKALEWELSLDKRDLRSHAWYYASIPRQRAEEIVGKDGDFLVRDCVSQPGNYVLTCKTNGTILHFVINKVLIQRDTVYERVQYQFEDEAYDTVPDLITFYVGSGKAISAASGARIQFPCNRTYPLSFYTTKYGSVNLFKIQTVALNSPSLVSIGSRYTPYNQQLGNYNSYLSPSSSPPRTKRDTPPRLPTKKQRSQSLTPIQPGQPMTACSVSRFSNEKYCSADGVIEENGEDSQNSRKYGRQSAFVEKFISAGGAILQTKSPNENSTEAINRANIGHFSLISRSSFDHATLRKHDTQPLPRNGSGTYFIDGQRILNHSRAASLTRDGSVDGYFTKKKFEEDEEVTTPIDSRPSPPPKPIRSMTNLRHHDSTMTLKDLALDTGPLNRVVSYRASGSDSGNGSGDSAQSLAANDATLDAIHQHQLHRTGGVIIRNPQFLSNSASLVTLKSFADLDYQAIEDNLLALDTPQLEQCSKFDLENFQTLLLPSIENKPLDNDALNTLRLILCETAARVIANHLTRIDIKLILGDVDNLGPNNRENKCNILDCTGIELVTLSHGEQFRRDLIERTECIRLLVAVTILTCSNDEERAEMLSKWIQIAIDTKTALGNLFGFSCIMLGLCMSQVQKLETTWHILRQKYTDSAFNFEAKLRPTLTNMNNCTNPQAPNTTVPHLLPYVLLRDRTITDTLDFNQSTTSSLISTCITPWETNAADFGLTIIHDHLESARTFNKNVSLYQRNAQIVMSDSRDRIDELLEDSFRTEFHMKFLWGSKGALASAEERHTKLEQVLSRMAQKFCGDPNVLQNADQAG